MKEVLEKFKKKNETNRGVRILKENFLQIIETCKRTLSASFTANVLGFGVVLTF